jgi:hypothetical protein
MFRKIDRVSVVLCVVGAVFFSARMAAGQAVVKSFDGDRGPGAAVCDSGVMHCPIPDMDAGANGKVVVQVSWQNVRVYDLNGRLLQSTPMTTFIKSAGLDPVPPDHGRATGPVVRGPIEPHVVYDEFISRWIVTVTGVSDSMIVSATPDPMGKWSGVNLSCLQGGPCLNTDPAVHVGFDKNGVYYCAGHIGDSNENTIVGVAYDCFAVPSQEVAAIGMGSAPNHINRAHGMPLDIMPAVDHTKHKAPGTPAYFVTKSCTRAVQGGCQNGVNDPFDWVVESFTWNGATGTWGEQRLKTDVGSMGSKWLYNKPCCGAVGSSPQAGSEIMLRGVESHRLANVVQAGSHVEGVMGSGPCTKDCGAQGVDKENVLLWFDLDCAKPTACVVSQTAKISGGFNPTYATVGIDATGSTGIVAESWTPGTNLSVLLWTRRRSDPPNTFQGPQTVVAGTHPYTCDNSHGFATIGNAAGIMTALDPVDGTKLWTTEQWGNDAARCVWNTRIIEYRIIPSVAKQGKATHYQLSSGRGIN